MNFEEFKEFFIQNIKIINVNLKEDELNNLYIYMKELLKWNEKINVTSIKDEKEFIIKHYIDSLSINKYIEGNKIIDVGTGGGFPGIPLKIINLNKSFTLIDSVNKKLNVIRSINEIIKLENLEIIHERAEILYKKKEYYEKYDVAITRAVSNFSNIAKYMLPFLKIGGKAICMKGPNYEKELDSSIETIKRYGGKIVKVENLKINENYDRNIIIIEKEKTTNRHFF